MAIYPSVIEVHVDPWVSRGSPVSFPLVRSKWRFSETTKISCFLTHFHSVAGASNNDSCLMIITLMPNGDLFSPTSLVPPTYVREHT